MSQYDDDTALQADGPGRWTGTVSGAWNIGDNPNGGYLVSLVMRAFRTLGPHQDPLSITTHFLRPGSPDAPCVVEAELVRTGRTLTTVRGRLVQEGKERLEVLAAFGDLGDIGAAEPSLTLEPPDMPPPEECPVRSGEEQGVSLPLLDRLDIRIHPDQFRAGEAGAAEMSGWIRLADGTVPDTRSVVMFADAFAPSLFGLLGVVGWVPTIELTVHVRRRPAPGWVMGRFRAEDLRDGRMIESGALWDEGGALVAQSRQLGLLLTH